MTAETDLVEMLMDAISHGRIYGVEFRRNHGTKKNDLEMTRAGLAAVVLTRLDDAIAAARAQGEQLGQADYVRRLASRK